MSEWFTSRTPKERTAVGATGPGREFSFPETRRYQIHRTSSSYCAGTLKTLAPFHSRHQGSPLLVKLLVRDEVTCFLYAKDTLLPSHTSGPIQPKCQFHSPKAPALKQGRFLISTLPYLILFIICSLFTLYNRLHLHISRVSIPSLSFSLIIHVSLPFFKYVYLQHLYNGLLVILFSIFWCDAKVVG